MTSLLGEACYKPEELTNILVRQRVLSRPSRLSAKIHEQTGSDLRGCAMVFCGATASRRLVLAVNRRRGQ